MNSFPNKSLSSLSSLALNSKPQERANNQEGDHGKWRARDGGRGRGGYDGERTRTKASAPDPAKTRGRVGVILAAPHAFSATLTTTLFSTKNRIEKKHHNGELLGVLPISISSLSSTSELARDVLPLLLTSKNDTWITQMFASKGHGIGFNPDFIQSYLPHPSALPRLQSVSSTHFILSGVEQCNLKGGYVNLDVLGAAAFGTEEKDYYGRSNKNEVKGLSPQYIKSWQTARRELLEEAGLLIPFSWIFEEAIVTSFVEAEIVRPRLQSSSSSSYTPLKHVTFFTVAIPLDPVFVLRDRTVGEGGKISHQGDDDWEEHAINFGSSFSGVKYVAVERG